MSRRTLIAAAAALFAMAITPVVLAQPKAPGPEQAYGYQLMTPAERDEYRKKMQEAKTPEERTKLRDEHRAAMSKRAQEAGVTLPRRGGEPRMYGQPLVSPEERQAYMDKMRAAQTAEERIKLRDDHRALMLKRAEEQGVTLRGSGGEPRLYGQELMSPQERQAHIDKMRAAATREERIKLRDEHRAEMRKRAQEQGVSLPEPRGPRGPGGPGGGPGPGPGAPK